MEFEELKKLIQEKRCINCGKPLPLAVVDPTYQLTPCTRALEDDLERFTEQQREEILKLQPAVCPLCGVVK